MKNLKIDENSRLAQTDLEESPWMGGFWGRLFNHCKSEMLSSMESALLDKHNAAYLGNFDAASGKMPNRHYGTYWSDGDCYKWLEAVAYVYAVTKSSELDAVMDKYIDKIAAAQEEDGYICTQIQLSRHRTRWSDMNHHELYNIGHLLTAAVVHHRATGKTSFLDVARSAGDHLYSVFYPRPKILVHFGFNPSQIMGCVDLYRATGEDRYLELAEIFVDMRGSAHGGTDNNQSHVPVKEEDEAVGHAVTANYLWAGATDVLREKKDDDLRDALERIWDNVTQKKMYVTGGVAPLYRGLSSRGDNVVESFAWEYRLPNRRGYNETCANIAFAMWNQRFLTLTGDAKYGDMLELVMYNSGLSGGSHDGTSFYYANPLSRRMHALFKETKDAGGNSRGVFRNSSEGARWKTHSCYCCPPQYVRTVAKMHTWSYGKAEKELWVHLYGMSEFKGTIPGAGRVHLSQKSKYPWEGEVVFEIAESPGVWSLKLRIPGWCSDASLTINGKTHGETMGSGTYVTLQRKWETGDTVELHLTMNPVMIQANPLVEENHGLVCLKRGPAVYCLESPELPAGVSMDDVVIPQGASIASRFEEGFFDGAVLLDVDCLVAASREFGPALYKQLADTGVINHTLTFIPYFLMANREIGEMSVWFPVNHSLEEK